MELGRREFLQRLGITLAALGMSDMALTGFGDRYQQAFARSSRQLALLVGINQYPDNVWQQQVPSDKGAFLQGALMDVELQRELLIHRFGMASADIMTLVDKQATRTGILEAIQNHLVDQARPGDTIIFHFSGLGSLVHLAGCAPDRTLPTLVPIDGSAPKSSDAPINDLFEATLVQSLTNLKGVRVLTVLDASGVAPNAPALQGNFRVRSRLTVPTGQWIDPIGDQSEARCETVEQLSTNWPGLLLRASRPGAPALEGSWNGFSAGVFTYALTQQIWNSVPSQRQQWILHRAENTMEEWIGTKVSPQLQGTLSAQVKEDLLAAGGVPKPAADGVVETVNPRENSATLWLGGVAASLLPYCTLGMRLKPLPSMPGLETVTQNTLSIKALKGLNAKIESPDIDSLPPGTPLIEVERRLPRDLFLTVALDPSLERIERVDATSALSALSYITTTATGEQQVDCLLGRWDSSGQALEAADNANLLLDGVDADASPSALTDLSGYGLFSPNHTLIRGTVPEADEAVKTAVTRLSKPLRDLLAIKMLRLTANPMSSQLPLRVSFTTIAPNRTIFMQEETLRSRQFAGRQSSRREKQIADAGSIDASQKFQIHLINSGQQPLYYLILGVTEKDRVSIYCPLLEEAVSSDQPAEMIADNSQLLVGKQHIFPQKVDNALSIEQMQSTEIFAIACVQPFYETWKAIRTSEFRPSDDRLVAVADPLPVAQGILNDLNRASLQEARSPSSEQEQTLLLTSNVWATITVTTL